MGWAHLKDADRKALGLAVGSGPGISLLSWPVPTTVEGDLLFPVLGSPGVLLLCGPPSMNHLWTRAVVTLRPPDCVGVTVMEPCRKGPGPRDSEARLDGP